MKILLAISIIAANSLYAQSDRRQLEGEIKRTDSIGVAARINLSIAVKDSAPEYSIELLNEAVKFAKQANNQRQISISYNSIASTYSMQGNYEKAIQYYDSCLVYIEKDDSAHLATVMSNMGNLYVRAGSYDNAIDRHMKSYAIRIAMGDEAKAIFNCHTLSVIFKEVKQFDYGLKYARMGLRLIAENEVENPRVISSLYSSLAGLHRYKGNFDSSHFYYNKCLKLEVPEISRAQLYNSIANTHQMEGNNDLALDYFFKSLTIAKKYNNHNGMSNNHNSIGNLLFEMGRYEEALPHVEAAMEQIEATKNIDALSDAYKTLAKLYFENQDYKNAYRFMSKHQILKDSLYNEQFSDKIANMQAEFDIAEQKHTNDLLLKQQEADKLALDRKNLEIKKQEERTLFITIGAFLVSFLLLGSFIAFRRSRKANKIIQTQKHKVDKAYEELEVKNTEILDSINYAKRIQSAILPPNKLVKEYLKDSFILYKPKDIVAGDFYWLEVLPGSPPLEESEEVGNTILFAAADCTGHGVPGAMVSVVCNNGLNRSVREHGLTDPGLILDKTREIVISEFEKSEEDVKDGMDIALCSLSGSTLKYAGAHNPLWLIRSGAEDVEEIKANKQPIGKYDEPTPYETHTIELNTGDTFYTFSDGYADQFGGEKGKKLKAKNFKNLLLSIQKEPMERQRELIDEAFETWKGDFEQLDDVCVIGVRV